MRSQATGFSIGTATTLTVILLQTLTFVWLGGGMQRRVEENAGWIQTNRDIPGCAKKNEQWIRDNRDLPRAMERTETYLKIFNENLKDLTIQLRILNDRISERQTGAAKGMSTDQSFSERRIQL